MIFEPLTQLPTAWSMVSGRFGVHLFEGPLTVAEMTEMQRRGNAWHAKHPGRIVELVVIYPSDDRMTQAERSKMVQLMKQWEHVRDAAATVILAEGLMGSLHRSILTGLMMLAPAPHPAKVFNAVEPAVDFLVPFVQPLTPGLSRAAVRVVTQQFEARPGRALPR